MFDSNIQIFGKHAQIIKKYSKNSQADATVSFIVLDQNGNSKEITLFNTMMQTYLVSCALGIASQKSAEITGDRNDRANIFSEIVIKKREDLIRLVQFMLLTEENEDTINSKIKKAFSVRNMTDSSLEEKLNGYALGGLEILDSYFGNCQTEEDVAHAIGDFNLDYSVLD